MYDELKMDSEGLSVLPERDLFDIALNLSNEQLFSLCETNTLLNSRLCGNNEFWRFKYLQTFDLPENSDSVEDWKALYMDTARPVLISVNMRTMERELVLKDDGIQGIGSTVGPNYEDTRLFVLSNGTVFSRDVFGEWVQTEFFPDTNSHSIDLTGKIVRISSSKNTILALDEDGQVYVNRRDHKDFVIFPLPEPVKTMVAGRVHQMVLFESGTLYRWSFWGNSLNVIEGSVDQINIGDMEVKEMNIDTLPRILLTDRRLLGVLFPIKQVFLISKNVDRILTFDSRFYHLSNGKLYQRENNGYVLVPYAPQNLIMAKAYNKLIILVDQENHIYSLIRNRWTEVHIPEVETVFQVKPNGANLLVWGTPY